MSGHCKECGATFRSWKTFKVHVSRKHKIECNDNDESAEIDAVPMTLAENNEEFPMEVDHVEEPHSNESEFDRLQNFAMQFVFGIRENCNLSESAMSSTINGEEFSTRQNAELKTVHIERDVIAVLQEKYPPTIIFSSIQTRSSLNNILIQQYNMKIRSNILNPKRHTEGLYRIVLDGQYYRENNFFKNNSKAIGIISYYNDICVANPLGSAANSQKPLMFYWTIANIYPEYRSSLNAFQLYAIVKTKLLKKSQALDVILESFVQEIEILQTTGIDVYVDGRIHNFKGLLLFCAGDTPASASLGGFKESVSAHRPCRTCVTDKHQWKHNFKEEDFHLRNEIEHQDHTEAVTDQTLTLAAKNYWKKFYGVNRKSPLIKVIDVTKCLPQDTMHVVIEGLLQLMCKLVLQKCIVQLQLFSVSKFYQKLNNFEFGHLKKDKPISSKTMYQLDGFSWGPIL
ncbi:uncharacterized protein LOC106643519 [Copidosoma floridanum]|uniref:uncharacterized protein LOC106643519 n=1 Tax=Copidosoma floridanum TaxID=29053 RepID=UPI0006C97CF6|nr:uncharacterized protein LOC106643519 [Copidosoma floridanum]